MFSKLNNVILQICQHVQNFSNIWRARSRLYRNRFLHVNFSFWRICQTLQGERRASRDRAKQALTGHPFLAEVKKEMRQSKSTVEARKQSVEALETTVEKKSRNTVFDSARAK